MCVKVYSVLANGLTVTLDSFQDTENSPASGFQCDQCQKSYNYKKSLIRHKKIAHLNQTFPCSKCSKSFKYASVITRKRAKNMSTTFVPNAARIVLQYTVLDGTYNGTINQQRKQRIGPVIK